MTFPGRTWVPSALPGLFNALAFPPYCAEEMAPLVDSKNRAEHCSPIARLQTFWLNVTARCRRVVRSRSRTMISRPLCNSRAALPLRLCLAKKARQERLEHPMTRTSKRAVNLARVLAGVSVVGLFGTVVGIHTNGTDHNVSKVRAQAKLRPCSGCAVYSASSFVAGSWLQFV